MRGVYVMSYPKKGGKGIVSSFDKKGLRYFIYVASLKIKGHKVEVIEL